MSAPKSITSFKINRQLQLLFMLVMMLGWLMPLIYLAFWLPGNYFSRGTIVYQLSTVAIPLAWFGLSVWLVWDHYRTVFTRVFAATFVTTIGYGLFAVSAGIEQLLRMKYYPPVIAANDNSWLTAFGHEWLIDGIGLGLFAAIILWVKYRKPAA
jgi:hypothetical protein